ncbi:hypothetical protein H4R18_002784 [Coemansia javaensis]|uniref:Peptidase C51 domain-containing protein n=1 Tax=Coemansia javaensis TaxID=2761396 RepID=A0A9W8HC52_9FUNG|nr:hypothetical protein H4R18_002784 [Coemansia javaensis]
MKPALLAAPLLLVSASAAARRLYQLNDKSDYANCRAAPTTDSPVVRQYKAGDTFGIECQVSGMRVFDYAIWDKTSDGCYLTDYYVDTGAPSAYVADYCLYDGPDPGPAVDDYRYRDQCDEVDPWNYYICQCVSFVAQRINERQRIYFTNAFGGSRWGDAGTWADAARNTTGVRVDRTPRPGCIAQHRRSALGHVAWVHSVCHANRSVTVEQYNVVPHQYSSETVPWDAFDYYIHLDHKH